MALAYNSLQRVSLSQILYLLCVGLIWGALMLVPLFRASTFQPVILTAVSVALTFILGLRITGHFEALRIRSRRNQFATSFGVLIICSLVCTGVAHRFISGEIWTIGWFNVLLSHSIALPILWLGLKFDSVRKVLIKRSKILTATTYEDHVRLRWHLARFGYRGEVDLVDFKAEDFKGPQDFRDYRVFVVSPSTNGLTTDTAPFLASFLSGVPVVEVEHLITVLAQRIDTTRTDQSTFLRYAPRFSLRRRLYETFKAVLEPFAAAGLLLLLSPVMLGVAWAIRASGTGPILFRQVREGQFGALFTLLKFRTMRCDAEKDGPQWSSGDADCRVTQIGKFLRATRLDELPQLVNVLRGEMSFIGPRPERPEISETLLAEIPAFRLRNTVKPGITGWAQVRSGYAASVSESQTKLEYDLFYALNVSFALDLEILIKTVLVGVLGESKILGEQRAKVASLLSLEEIPLKESRELQSAASN